MAGAAHSASHLAAVVAARWIAGAGLALSVAGALMLSRSPATAHYVTDLLPGLLLLGFGIGLVFVSVSVSMTAMNGIPAQHAGTASGFLMTGHEVGAALGVAIISAVAATDRQSRDRCRCWGRLRSGKGGCGRASCRCRRRGRHPDACDSPGAGCRGHMHH
jgi:hypothetical protein